MLDQPLLAFHSQHPISLSQSFPFLVFVVAVMEELSVDEKVKIASGFLLASPPGEVNDVFNGTTRDWKACSCQHCLQMLSNNVYRCPHLGRQ